MKTHPGYQIVSLALVLLAAAPMARAAANPELRDVVAAKFAAEYPSLEAIYKNLHANPELSFMETKTAALVAKELRALGIEVTEKVGNTGVVGVLKNGTGPTVLIRADMDGLPVKEMTGLPWASTTVGKDLSGKDQPTMHACGHDLHITGFIGTARTLVALKDQWKGTIVFVAQPAEEIVSGARAMLTDGLYTRFPKPDFALALHVFTALPAGMVGFTEGPTYASVRSVDIVVRGVGGHGSAPHTTKDPIVIASQLVLALQTIVSREIEPGTPAVVTVGAIHGGTKRNIISEEVTLELTLRSFDDKVMDQLVAAIRRISAGIGQTAGVPNDRMPVVTVNSEAAPVTVNDPALTRRVVNTFKAWFPADRVVPRAPITGAEDFSEFARTVHRVPAFIWTVGAADPDKHAAAAREGRTPAANHSPTALFVHDPTLQTCVTSMSAAVLDLLGKK
ncbi:MAG: amidohydrolase [Opitutus sp.]|nr:amidohydrolase [Opitutus sp.]